MKKYPLNMYSVPEMAQIGLTEKDIQEEGIEYKEVFSPYLQTKSNDRGSK
jgi:pyruvate/2-oxoglutarate dehydrogenase complex dihydrolipoamide dehydrogenase (E3) component